MTLATPDPDLRRSQLEDELIGPFLRAKEAKTKPNQQEAQAMSPSAKRLLQIWDQLVLQENLLYRLYEEPDSGTTRL